MLKKKQQNRRAKKRSLYQNGKTVSPAEILK